MNERTLASGLLLVAGLALGACGGGGGGSGSADSSKPLSPAAYRQQLRALDRQDTRAHANVDGLPHAKTVGAIETALAAFAADEARIGRQVAALKPPANAASANAALATAFRDSAADMSRVRAAIAHAKTPREALGIIGKLGPTVKSGPELDAALARLKKLGYASGS